MWYRTFYQLQPTSHWQGLWTVSSQCFWLSQTLTQQQPIINVWSPHSRQLSLCFERGLLDSRPRGVRPKSRGTPLTRVYTLSPYGILLFFIKWPRGVFHAGALHSVSGEGYILASSKSTAQSHSGKLYKLVDPKRYRLQHFFQTFCAHSSWFSSHFQTYISPKTNRSFILHSTFRLPTFWSHTSVSTFQTRAP